MNQILRKISKLSTYIFLVTLLLANTAKAQLPVKVIFGRIAMDDGYLGRFQSDKYKRLSDSLDKILKVNPKDTTSLFNRAAILLFSNDIFSKPYQREKGALEALVLAKNMVEKAISLNMKDFRLKILRAQIYNDLTYRFTGDESWMFNSKQIADRKKEFNSYKEMANKYYDELAKLDQNNAYEYQKLKVKYEYPLN